MAELQQPNYYQNWTSAYQRGQDSAFAKRLRDMAAKGYQTPASGRQSLLSEMAAVSPEFAQQQGRAWESQENRQREQLAQLARGWKSIADPVQRRGYYDRFVLPVMGQMGFGDIGQYDEKAVDDVATQILAAYGPGMDQAQVHSAFRGQNGTMWVLDRSGNVRDTGAAFDPNNQIIDTGNGFFGVNKSNLSAAPVTVGAPTASQPSPIPAGGQFTGPDGMPVQLDPGLDPSVQQAILANPSAWAGAPDGSTATLPPRQASQQLRSAPKPQAPSELERRIQIAQQMGATPEEQRRMVIGGSSARDAQRISAKDATTARQKVTQIQAARNQLRSARQAFEKIKNSFSAGLGGDYLPTPEGQAFDRAVRNLAPLITAVTRVPGVGAMSDYESRLQEASLPSRGTYENVTLQQFQDLENLLNTVEGGYKDLLSGGQEAPTQADNETSIDDLLDMYR